ncbi:MAG: hypothetical protein WBZ11_01215 [Candidatus Sulfotelmatobacter sp.]
MANDNPNPLFAYVEARIAAWQAVLASLKSAMTLDASGLTAEGLDFPSAPHNGDVGQPIDLPEGAFHGKSVPACIELYLSSAPMKKRTNKQIATALREGGVESNASNFDNTVTGALFKLKSDGKLLRFKDGWGLSSWYPAHIRAVNPAAPSKRSKKKGKRNGRQNVPAKAVETAQATPGKGKANVRILELLRTKPEREYSLAEIAGHIEMGVQGARLALGKLVKAGNAKVSAPCMYAIARPQLVAAGD